MAASYESSYVIGTDIESIREVVRDTGFSSALRLEMKSENPIADGVWYRFHHGTTFTSWGEKITITLGRVGEASTSLSIFSECALPTQVIDWGKNRKNVHNIFEYIEKQLAARNGGVRVSASAAPSGTNAYASCDGNSSSDPTPRFCSKCGARVSAEDIFCAHCGNKLK